LALLGLGILLRDGHYAALDSAVPIAGNQSSASARSVVTLQIACAALAEIIAFSVQAWAEAAKVPPPTQAVALQAPDFTSWTVTGGDVPTWNPVFHGTDAELQKSYLRGGERVDLHVGYYAYQREGAEAVSDLNVVTGRSDAKVLRARTTTIQTAGASVPIKEFVVLSTGKPRLVWTWYHIGGSNTNSRLVGKILEIKALAMGGERAAAIVAVSAEVSENVEGTAILLNAFLQENLGKDGSLYRVEPSPDAAPKPPTDPTGKDVKP
jgi:EpsI family protein